jgi:hypothetical protein
MNEPIKNTLQLLVAQAEAFDHQHSLLIEKLNFEKLKTKQLEIDIKDLRENEFLLQRIRTTSHSPMATFSDDPITLRRIIVTLMETFAHSDTLSVSPSVATARKAARLLVRRTHDGIFEIEL